MPPDWPMIINNFLEGKESRSYINLRQILFKAFNVRVLNFLITLQSFTLTFSFKFMPRKETNIS